MKVSEPRTLPGRELGDPDGQPDVVVERALWQSSMSISASGRVVTGGRRSRRRGRPQGNRPEEGLECRDVSGVEGRGPDGADLVRGSLEPLDIARPSTRRPRRPARAAARAVSQADAGTAPEHDDGLAVHRDPALDRSGGDRVVERFQRPDEDLREGPGRAGSRRLSTSRGTARRGWPASPAAATHPPPGPRRMGADQDRAVAQEREVAERIRVPRRV